MSPCVPRPAVSSPPQVLSAAGLPESTGCSAPAVGLDGVVAVQSRLSKVDGLRGRLLVAGLPVEALAGQVEWSVIADRLFALAHGRAHSAGSARALREALGVGRVAASRRLPVVLRHLEGAEGVASVRAVLPWLVGGGARGPAPTSAELIAALHVAAAAWLRLQSGQAPVEPDPDRAPAADLLRMCLGDSGAAAGPDPQGVGAVPAPVAEGPPGLGEDARRARVQALDTYLGTVVDHGLNASTFAARVVASTQSDALSAVVAALGALKGPLHGGAPGPVLDMLDSVGAPERARSWLTAELAAGRRIMGMGHRVYRVRDPRAAVLEGALAALPGGGLRRRLAQVVEAEATAVLDARHPGRRLRANVEFGTAVLLEALGFPRASFTVLFACSRVAGWLAHSVEQRRTGRLLRPRLAYIGPTSMG